MANSHKNTTRADAHPPGEVTASILMDDQGGDPSSPAASKKELYVKSGGLYLKNSSGTVVGPMIDAAGGGAYTQGCRVYNSSNTSINNTTDTYLTFDTERYDTDTMHDTGSNTGRITFTTAGKYHVGANVDFASNGSGYRQLFVLLNATDVIAIVTLPAASGIATRLALSTIWSFSASDYVELGVTQSSGGSLNVLTSAKFSPEFFAQRIG